MQWSDEHGELVAPEPGQQIAFAHFGLQDLGELAQQLVAGNMSAGIVDNLELIQIQITQGVLAAIGVRSAQGPLQIALELGPIDQTRETVVGRLIGELLGQIVGLRNIGLDPHVVGQMSRVVENRRHAQLVPEQRPIFAIILENSAVVAARAHGGAHLAELILLVVFSLQKTRDSCRSPDPGYNPSSTSKAGIAVHDGVIVLAMVGDQNTVAGRFHGPLAEM